MRSRPGNSHALLAAALLLSTGAHLARFSARMPGLVMLVLSLLLLVAGVARRGGIEPTAEVPRLRVVGSGPPWRRWLVLLGVTAHGLLLLRVVAGGVAGPLAVVGTLLAVCLILLGVDLVEEEPRSGRMGVIVAGVLTAALYAVTIVGSDPLVDVRAFQESGVDTLLAGVDPYARGIYPDIYDAEASHQFYGTGLSIDGMLQFGYPYMPLSLLLAVPFVVLGDVRMLHLVVLLATAFGVMRLRGGTQPGRIGALVLVTSPIVLSVVRGAWNDLLLVVMLAALILAWDRRRDLLADVLLGLMLATKQSAVFFVPIYLALAARRRDAGVLRPLVPAGIAFTVITLPFLLRSGGDMVFSTVVLQFLQPFREDSQSLLFLFGADPPRWSALLALVAAAAATVWAARRARADAAGLAGSMGLVLLSFLLLSKQSFGNYYTVVLGCIVLALAATRVPSVDGTSAARGGGDGTAL